MFGGNELLWAFLIIISIGGSFHRMGPSFDRSKFGFPLILLGLSCLIFFPGELTENGVELHKSFLKSVSIALPFAIGAIIVLRNSPTYGGRSIPGLFAGWIFIIASWAAIFLEKDTYSIIAITRGALVIMGILAGLVAVFIGVYLAERSSGFRDESEPLSKEEGDLVRAILERRLGGRLE